MVGKLSRPSRMLFACALMLVVRGQARAEIAIDPVAAVSERVRPAVVQILTVRPPAAPATPADPNSPHEAATQRATTAIGSGFIIDPKGFVATNKHVVDGAISVFVTSLDGLRHQARIVATTHNADIALLKIDPWPNMPTVPFGDSDKVVVGQRVIAIGSPFGFDGSVSTGVVSAVNRDIMESPFDDYIQTDAAINHGNSGGPLFNLDGQVVGMNSVLFAPGTGSVGLGFSIPSNELNFVYSRMEANDGRIWAGMLPLRTQPVTWMLAQAMGATMLRGALVAGLDGEGDRMMEGQIKPGDIILAMNGMKVSDPRDLARKAAIMKIGSDAELQLQRGVQQITVHVKIQPYPEDPPPPFQRHVARTLGVTLASVPGQGITVSDVDVMGTAADSGLQKGDVVLQVQQDVITDPTQALRLMELQASLFRPFAAVLVRRDGKPTWIAVTIP